MQFDARLLRRELPVDRAVLSVPLSNQCLHPRVQGGHVAHRARQAAPLNDAALDLRHIQPTSMLGGVMGLQLAQDAPGPLWWEGLVERPREYRKRFRRPRPASLR